MLLSLIAVLFVSMVTIEVGCQDVPVDITHSLLTLLAEEKQLRLQLEKELTTLGSEITTLQNLEANVTCGCPWHQIPVAFTATLTNDITNLGSQQQISFDKIITNVGGGYDARHGEFRAPVTGIYEFSVSMLMKAGQWSGLEIVKDGTPIAKVRSGDSSHWTMSATVVTTNLTSGQDVWVQHISETDSNVIYGQTFSTFSGHLIQPSTSRTILRLSFGKGDHLFPGSGNTRSRWGVGF